MTVEAVVVDANLVLMSSVPDPVSGLLLPVSDLEPGLVLALVFCSGFGSDSVLVLHLLSDQCNAI